MSKTTLQKVQAKELQPGQVIDPPTGEKVWLWRDGVKRRYTIQSVTQGKRTKKGQFVKINGTVPSPYREEEPTDISCEILETKLVTLR